jgi:hypothetical protein
MPPLARIIHQTRSRVRLRIGEKRKDPEYFEQVGNQLGSVSGISELRTNSNTGCILLLHPEQTWAELEPQLQQLGLFEITEAAEPEKPALEPLLEGFSRINQALTAGSSGRVDLRTLTYIGMMALTINQIMRGQVLGPALPMLWNALSLVERFTRSAMDGGLDSDGSE